MLSQNAITVITHIKWWCKILVFVFIAFGMANITIGFVMPNDINECGDSLSYCVLTIAVISFMSALFVVMLHENISADDYFHIPKKNKLFIGFVLGINIWACVAYFSIDLNCYKFYLDTNIHLLHILLADVILFFTNISILAWILLFSWYKLRTDLVLNNTQNNQNDHFTLML